MQIEGNINGAYVEKFRMDDGTIKSTSDILQYILETIENLEGGSGGGGGSSNEDYIVDRIVFALPATWAARNLLSEQTMVMVTYVGTNTFSIGTAPGLGDILPPTPPPAVGHETHVLYYFNLGPNKNIYFNGPGTVFVHLAKNFV